MKPMENLAAVIPVAGHGTRMYPLTRAIKKELLPLVDPDGRPRPLIQILAEEALESGLQQVCFVVNRQQRNLFESYFHGDFSDDPGAQKFPEEAEKIRQIAKRVFFVDQSEQLGLGHAVSCAVETLGRKPLMVLLGDHAFANNSRPVYPPVADNGRIRIGKPQRSLPDPRGRFVALWNRPWETRPRTPPTLRGNGNHRKTPC